MDAEAEALQYQVMSTAPPAPITSPITNNDDPGAALLARHIDGDAAAFAALVNHYRGSVYGVFRRSVPAAEADDLFQETFMRVHKDAHRYEARRPFRVWLFTIAHNLLRSHHRRRVVRRVLVDWWIGDSDSGMARDPADPSPATDDIVSSRQRMRWLEDALGRLPERQRQALVLTQIEGLSLEETSEILGAPVATIKTWVFRARHELASAHRAHEGAAP